MRFTVFFSFPALVSFFILILVSMWAPAAAPFFAGLTLALGMLAALAFVLEAMGFLTAAAQFFFGIERK